MKNGVSTPSNQFQIQYSTEGVTGTIGFDEVLDSVIHGDATEILKTLPENSVDLLLTDPPYNIAPSFQAEFPERNPMPDQFRDWDDGTVQPEDWIPQAARVLTRNGVLIAFYDNREMYQVLSAVDNQGLEFRQKIYWHKKNPVPQIYGVKWQEAVEEAVVATANTGKGHHYQNQRGQHHNIIETPICGNAERQGHPTQKPKALFRPIIKWWSQTDDIVLDPFNGTGTVCVVAQELGRHYIGIEQQEKHVQTARERLSQKSLHNYSQAGD